VRSILEISKFRDANSFFNERRYFEIYHSNRLERPGASGAVFVTGTAFADDLVLRITLEPIALPPANVLTLERIIAVK
jgi:hypothetical protein